MKAITSLILLAILGFILLGMGSKNQAAWNENTPVFTLLNAFGEPLPAHAPKEINKDNIERGRDLVFDGMTIGPDGKKSKRISKFYVCTSCHSTFQEDPDLRFFNPETRLDYVASKGLKFLQGSPFFGIANRETWYNDDYVLKYGDLVKPANTSLAESTQLCAKVCSSGRYLEDWELEAILAYYWEIQFKIKDLNFSPEEWKKIENAGQGSNSEIVQLIKSKYALKSPATFDEGPHDKSAGYGLEGRPDKGKMIYELSCQACHIDGGVAGMPLETDKLTFQKFKRNLNKKGDYNLYDIIRHGTYADLGKPRYMPLYPKERMSDQQVEDLRAYILQEAK